MKRFNELTNEEKVVLTSEQVEYYAKLDCANRGIIIPQKPINQLKDVIKPSEKYYQVGWESFVFKTEQDAQEYVDIKNKTLSIKSFGSNDYQFADVRNNDRNEITAKVFYTKEEAETLKEVLTYNSETLKEWNSYNESLKEYNEILEDMFNEIKDILYYNSRQSFYDKIYQDYLELANNDDSVAFTFFEKAYKNSQLSDIDREIVDKMLKVEDTCVEHQG